MKRWFEVNEIYNIEDTSGFEEPDDAPHIIRYWMTRYINESPGDAAIATSQEIGCSIEEVCQALEHTREYMGIARYGAIIRAHMAKKEYREAIDDFDVSEFEEPIGIEGQAVQLVIPDEDYSDAETWSILKFNGRLGIILAPDPENESRSHSSPRVRFEGENHPIFFVPIQWLHKKEI